MNFDRETLDGLVQLAQHAQAPQHLAATDGDPRTIHYAIDGKLATVARPVVRANIANSLADIIALARSVHAKAPAVWHNHNQVVLTYDDAEGIDWARFALHQSKPIRALESNYQKRMGQVAFVRFLRVDLQLPPEQIAPFRKLDWTSGDNAGGQVAHGTSKLGRSIEAQVANAADLPEEMTVSLPLYEVCGERTAYPIRCLVDIDPTERTLGLVPAAGAIEAAYDAHAFDIHARLETALNSAIAAAGKADTIAPLNLVPIYYGAF